MATQSFTDFVGRGQQNLYQGSAPTATVLPQQEIQRLLAEVQRGGTRAQNAIRLLQSTPEGRQAIQAVSAPAPAPAPAPVAPAPAPARPRPQTAQPTQSVDVQRPDPTSLSGAFFNYNPLGQAIRGLGRAHAPAGKQALDILSGMERFAQAEILDLGYIPPHLRDYVRENVKPLGVDLQEYEAAKEAQREIDRADPDRSLGRFNPFTSAGTRALSDPKWREEATQLPVHLPFIAEGRSPAFHLSALDVAGAVADPTNIIGVGPGTKIAKELRQFVPYLGTLQKPARRTAGQVLQEGGQSLVEEFAPVTRKVEEAARATGREALRQAERMPGGIPGVVQAAPGPIIPGRGEGFKLPSDLARSRVTPKFGRDAPAKNIVFESDFDRALYIATAKTRSARRDTFEALVREELQARGLDPNRMTEIAAPMKRAVQEAAQATDEVDVPFSAFRYADEAAPTAAPRGAGGVGGEDLGVRFIDDPTRPVTVDTLTEEIRGLGMLTQLPIEIEEVRVIGSRVKGTARGDSDLDVAIQFIDEPGTVVSEEEVFQTMLRDSSIEMRTSTGEVVNVDFVPLKRSESGTIDDFLATTPARQPTTPARQAATAAGEVAEEATPVTTTATDTVPPVTRRYRPGMNPAQIAETAKEDAARKIVPSPDAGGGGSIDELTAALAGLPEEDAAKALDNTYDSTRLDVNQLGLGDHSRLFGLEGTVDLKLSRIERLASAFAGLVGAKGLVHVDVVDALWNLRTRVINDAEKLAASQTLRIAPTVKRVFKPDKNGQIQSLINIDASLRKGVAPTIQDVAARLPRFLPHLNKEQIQVLEELREITAPHKKVLEESGVELGLRPDIIDGGFYVPRGNILLDDLDSGTIIVKRLGVPQSQVKAIEYPSMAEAILNGAEYSTFPKAIDALVTRTGQTVGDNFFAAAMRAMRNEDGIRLGRTAKELVIEESPEVFKQMEELRKSSTRLKNLIKQKNQKALKEMDHFIEDPGIDDIDQLITLFSKKRTVLRGTLKGAKLNQAEEALEILLAELKAFKPVYANEMETIAKRFGRKEIGGKEQFPRLHGVSFADIYANRANDLINKEIAVTAKDKTQYAKEALHGTNGIMRATTATADNSAMGIQLLVTGYDSPKVWHKASVKSLKAWGGEGVYASWAREFNDAAKAKGTFTTDEWAGRFGVQQSGKPIDVSSDILEEGLRIPGVRKPVGGFFQAAARAFSVAGDVARIERAEELLLEELAKGRTIDELIQAGDLRRIANHVNASSGFINGRFTLGNWIFYSTKFLFARMLTVARAMKGMDLDAPLDMVPIVGNKLRGRVPKINKFATMQDRYARRAILRLLGWGTILTVLANESRGEETDFRLYIKNREGKLYVNPNFVKIRNLGGRDRSIFGPFHGLLNLVASAAITPKTGEIANLAKRAINAPLASIALDFARNKKFDGTPIMNRNAPFLHQAGQFMAHAATNLRPFALDESMEYIGPGFNDFKEGDIVSGGISMLDMLGESYGAYSTPLSNSELRDLLDMEEDMDPQLRHEIYMILDSRQSGYEKFIVGEDFAPRYKKFKNDVYKKFGKPFGDLDSLAKSQLEKDPVLGIEYAQFDAIRSRATINTEGFEDKGAMSRTERRQINAEADSQKRAVLQNDIFAVIDKLGNPNKYPGGKYNVNEQGVLVGSGEGLEIDNLLWNFRNTVSDINNRAEGRKYQLQRGLNFDLYVPDPKSEFDKILNEYYRIYDKHKEYIGVEDYRTESQPWISVPREGSMNWDAINQERKAFVNSLSDSQQTQLSQYIYNYDDALVREIKKLVDKKDSKGKSLNEAQLFVAINTLRNQYLR